MSTPLPFITLEQAKAQLSIDDGLDVHDDRITFLIGSAIDWAQNYTCRSLGELMQLAAPLDEGTAVLADPLNVCDPSSRYREPGDDYAWFMYTSTGAPIVPNPIMQDRSKSLRRDVQAAILLQVELLFDRNVDNIELLQERAEALLDPYRTGMGV